MAKIIESRRILKSRLDAKQDVLRAIPALMGDGNGNVAILNQPGYVYVRIGDGDLGQAFNNRCPQRDNLAVYVGYDPVTDPDRRTFQVLSVRMSDYAGAGNTPIMNIPPHHIYHEYGGGDDVYVDWRRLMGLRVGRPSGFSITIDPGVILRAGVWTAIAAQTLDLTLLKPAGLQQARYILIALNAAGVATATPGAIVTIATLTIANCPIPAAGEIPLGAVRLYGIQTSIGDTPSAPDIVDLRFPQASMAGAVFLSSLSGWARGSIIRGGAAIWESYAKGAAFAVLTGDGTDTLWSGYLLAGTAGGKMNFAITNAKTLTLTSVGDYNITIPKTGTIPVGTGIVGQITEWVTDANTLQASTLIKTGTNTLTLATGIAAATTWTIPTNAAGVLTNDGAGLLSWGGGAPHNIFSVSHADTTGAASPIDGDLIIGNVTPLWSKLAISIPAVNVRNVLGIDNGELRPSWKATLDAINPTTIGIADAGGPGTSLVFSHRDHQHPSPATWTAAAHTIDGATHTVAGRTAGQFLIATAATTFGWSALILPNAATKGDIPYASATNIVGMLAGAVVDDAVLQYTAGMTNAPHWSTGALLLYTGSTLTLATGGSFYANVTNTKTLTLIATGDFSLTIPGTGTAVVGTAASFPRLAVWSDANTLAAGMIVPPASNVLTLLNSAASTLSLVITVGKTLTFTAANDLNLTMTGGMTTLAFGATGRTYTFPDETGTVALASGISGGQTLYGGTAANDDLILHGTAHGTRDTSYVVMQPTFGNVAIGSAAGEQYTRFYQLYTMSVNTNTPFIGHKSQIYRNVAKAGAAADHAYYAQTDYAAAADAGAGYTDGYGSLVQYTSATNSLNYTIIGGRYFALITSSASISAIRGLQFDATVLNGTVTNLIGVLAWVGVKSEGGADKTGMATNAYGIKVTGMADTVSTGTLTNRYGVWVGNQGTGATFYSIKTGTGIISFGDVVGILNAAPAYALDVTGAIRCSTGFGCNGATPQTAYSLGAASTDLATVIALANKLRLMAIGNGTGSA